MKTNRVFATTCLIASAVMVLAATGVTEGEEAGVVRLSAHSVPDENSGGDAAAAVPAPPPPAPIPDPAASAGTVRMDNAGPGAELYPTPDTYAPYFSRSYGATETVVPPTAFQGRQLFGPQLTYDNSIDDGLGYTEGYHRLNSRIPYHILPNQTVLFADLAAGVTNDGDALYNLGAVYRHYNPATNRIWGWNVFGDWDQSTAGTDWSRITFGVESLGKYIDWRANVYSITGNDSYVVTDELTGNLALSGSNVFRVRNQTRINAYDGFDFEAGGPLPLLGRYGINGYAGGYLLDADFGYEAFGVQGRVEALITESVTANVTYTNDDTFGSNAWVQLAYTIPNYTGQSRRMRPKPVQDRLLDPVRRSTRIHTNTDIVNVPEAVINPTTGRPWMLVHVDPNATLPGVGTLESPFMTLQQAVDSNSALVDLVRIAPNADDSGTNLTINGPFSLFDNQTLLSSVKDFTLYTDTNPDGSTTPFLIPGEPTTSNLGPLIQNVNMTAGGSVIELANNNTIYGLRLDASNAAGTVFGNGVSNALPITNVNLSCNTFTNYTNGALLQDVSGRAVIDDNTFSGLLGASQNGLSLTTASGQTVELLMQNNVAQNNSGTGLDVVVNPNGTLNASDINNTSGNGATGILNNTANDNGNGISVAGLTNSTVNAVIEGNTANNNTFNGITTSTDTGTFNLASMRGNTASNNLENGLFIHYRGNSIFNAISEDLNGDGVLDAGEDLNGNGVLDQGIVSNTFNDNTIAGICIFGEDTGQGQFDVGGPVATLGNTLNGNAGGGVLMDLQGSATGQIDALFNTMEGGSSGPASLTIVLDFIDPGQTSVVDGNGFTVNTFDIAAFGFNATQYDQVTNAILDTVRDYYTNLPTVSDNALSTIPDGHILDVDFVLGDQGVAPTNGATEYYYLTIGDSTDAFAGLAGLATGIGTVRDANGAGPNGIAQFSSAAGVYTNNINSFSPLLNPPNAFVHDGNGGITVAPDDQRPDYVINALTSGDLTFTRRAIGLVTAHELGHTLSLRHIENGTAITQNGNNAIMATPAIDAPLQVLVEPAEFALQGTNPGELPGEAPFQQNNVAQLASALGTRVAGGSLGSGVTVNATDNARLLASEFNNNVITGATRDGIAVEVSGNAVAEGVDVQGNTITGGTGNGIRLTADGAGAFIDADSTIGGSGTNTYGGVSYTQSNLISGVGGDGFRAHARNGATIHGNLLNNTITNSGGNGAALLIENGGTLDFGTPASNREISGNTITGSGGAGILLSSNTSANAVAQLDAVIRSNDISNNSGGGIIAQMSGSNNIPPAPPAVIQNNILNLTVGGTSAQANTLDANSDAGIGVTVTGNGKATLDIANSTITNTANGADPLMDGDGIYLRREDSSLLTANITNVTATGNAGDGLTVDTQGNDPTDPNQPMSGTPNTVTWNNNNFSNNGQNGASFRTRGDSVLIADGQSNTVNNNTLNGIAVQTSEFSTFGDSTDGLPPGRRVIFDGTTAEGNGQDGLNILATEQSRALVEVTSTRIAGSSGAHAALNTNGDSSFSNNARDGIHIETTGGRSDVLITSSSGQTTISGNGTAGGGNGIRIDTTGPSDGTFRITNTLITNNIAGASEDTNGDGVVNEDLNGNGVLDIGEDANGNGVLDIAEDLNENGDIDVADGDGIQFNTLPSLDGVPSPTLVVGGVGAGNVIQGNGDDGIAITATGSALTGTPQPLITITDNLIGGEADGLPAGNGGDGLSLNIFGGTAAIDPTTINTDLANGPLTPLTNGVIDAGPLVQMAVRGNTISQNGRRGANLLITGAAGTRDRSSAPGTFNPVSLIFDNNTIVSNGEEGMYFRGDSNMNQSRYTYLANFPFPNPPFNPADDRPLTPGFYSPLQPEFTNRNIGSVNGNTEFSPTAPDGSLGYLNLRTVQNTLLTITNNTIQNNGTNTVTGEGIVLRVGTGSYLAADIQDNAMGGNLDEDLVTDSFLSFGNTFASIDDAGDLTFDVVFWDDSAQLDMRFQDNSGNQIAPSSFGATYTDADPFKALVLGPVGVQNRLAGFFQVENSVFLESPNNTFINFGATQNINSAFNTGGYNIRAAADPLFPNIGFAPFLP